MTLRNKIHRLVDPVHEHRWLGLMMICLHLAVWWDFGGPMSRSILLAHFGMFLLWQPVWSRDQQLDLRAAAISVAGILGAVAWVSWGLMAVWLVLLTGIVGGRVLHHRRNRYAYLLALVFLVSELLVACVPPLVAVPTLTKEANMIYGYGLLLIPVAMLFIPGATSRQIDALPRVDFLYGLTVSLLICILAMGSLLGTFLFDVDYVTALVQTILAIALFLLAISWLWSPFAGFGGLGQLWERYLQTIGTPFEQWLARLDELAGESHSPTRFLEAALSHLAELPWVAGVSWSGGGTGGYGRVTPYTVFIRAGGLQVNLFSARPMSSALVVHARLLLQLLGHYYTAKMREQEMAANAHIRAVYETGARVTHDIKNLLQSLYATSVAVQGAGDEQRADALTLLERQLPHVTSRLQHALDRLQSPSEQALQEIPLGDWWSKLQARSAGQGIEFAGEPGVECLVPADFLDSVVENLLENARFKRQSEPDIHIEVKLESSPDRLSVTVSDDGSPVDEGVRGYLFDQPVASSSGLGIGLYQAARLAKGLGFSIACETPDTGACFRVSRDGSARSGTVMPSG